MKFTIGLMYNDNEYFKCLVCGFDGLVSQLLEDDYNKFSHICPVCGEKHNW